MASTLPPRDMDRAAPAPSGGEGGGEKTGAEQRESDRAPITLRVEYKRINTFFADYTRNISKGGTFIRTAKPLDVGTEFVFVLTYPSRTHEAPRGGSPSVVDRSAGATLQDSAETGKLELRGKVVWTVREDRATEEQPAGMGIRFLFDSDEARSAVDACVEKLMKETLGEQLSDRLLKGATSATGTVRKSDPKLPES